MRTGVGAGGDGMSASRGVTRLYIYPVLIFQVNSVQKNSQELRMLLAAFLEPSFSFAFRVGKLGGSYCTEGAPSHVISNNSTDPLEHQTANLLNPLPSSLPKTRTSYDLKS